MVFRGGILVEHGGAYLCLRHIGQEIDEDYYKSESGLHSQLKTSKGHTVKCSLISIKERKGGRRRKNGRERRGRRELELSRCD